MSIAVIVNVAENDQATFVPTARPFAAMRVDRSDRQCRSVSSGRSERTANAPIAFATRRAGATVVNVRRGRKSMFKHRRSRNLCRGLAGAATIGSAVLIAGGRAMPIGRSIKAGCLGKTSVKVGDGSRAIAASDPFPT